MHPILGHSANIHSVCKKAVHNNPCAADEPAGEGATDLIGHGVKLSGIWDNSLDSGRKC